MASGRNQNNKYSDIGVQVAFLSPNEGTDANGRVSQIVKDEFPTRIDEVNDFLFYLGWAELGAAEDEDFWKIRKIQKNGNVWSQTYANSNQHYRNKWSERSILSYG